MHLPGVGVREAAQIHIDDDEAAQTSMKEKQVYPIPFVINSEATLARDEREIVAEFEQEMHEVMHERILQIGLGVFVLQAEEFEHERILDFRRR